MKNVINLLLFTGVVFLLAGCKDKTEESGNVLTKRIQYDVPIVSPDPEFDWWVQNIEGAKREELVQNILGSAVQGKVKVYDFFSYKLLSPEMVQGILRRVDTVALESPDPPHELVDTVLVHELSVKDITRIRFLEEWEMNPVSLAFNKKVMGICPLVEVFTDSGESRGFKPLFWAFFDEKYPDALKAVGVKEE